MGFVLVARAHPPAQNAGRMGQPHEKRQWERMGQPPVRINRGLDIYRNYSDSKSLTLQKLVARTVINLRWSVTHSV